MMAAGGGWTAEWIVDSGAFCKIRQEAGFIVGKSCCPWERGRPARTRPGRAIGHRADRF